MISLSRTVDARGLSCPQPVILTKRVMDENSGDEIITLVDNSTSLENVCKLAKSQGYRYTVEELGAEQHIYMSRDAVEVTAATATVRNTTVLIKSQYLGGGSEELGAVLMNSFLYTLTESAANISHLIFMNSGVYLSVVGSPAIEQLRELESKGIKILCCGTCLDYFALKEKLAVGEVTNMYDATEVLLNADKVLAI